MHVSGMVARRAGAMDVNSARSPEAKVMGLIPLRAGELWSPGWASLRGDTCPCDGDVECTDSRDARCNLRIAFADPAGLSL